MTRGVMSGSTVSAVHLSRPDHVDNFMQRFQESMNFRRLGPVVVVYSAIVTALLAGCQPPSGDSGPTTADSDDRISTDTVSEQATNESEAIPQTDVLIVGTGISGLSAALELGRSGADVADRRVTDCDRIRRDRFIFALHLPD